MKFLKSKHFSFLYDGKAFEELDKECSVTETEAGITYQYAISDGILVTNIGKYYADFNAYEWVTWFENTSDTPSGIFSQINDADLLLEFSKDKPTELSHDTGDRVKVYAPTGSNQTMKEFYCDMDSLEDKDKYHNILQAGSRNHYANEGGRSSSGRAPFFNIYKNNHGYIAAIGWSGQWNCDLVRTEQGVNICTKIEDTYFRLLPGERIRTSSFVIMEYEGDFYASQNKWRRFVKNHFIPRRSNEQRFLPFSIFAWGGNETQLMLEKINCVKENNLPFEAFWIDSGWYGGPEVAAENCEEVSEWWEQNGEWSYSAAHPEGLKSVSDAAHSAGLDMIFWIEPERAKAKTKIVKEHPEYFMTSTNKGDTDRLVDLGNEEAWQWCYNIVADKVKELKLECYREDFNMFPLSFWRNNDSPERKGISEIKFIMGFYRLWDTLLEEFPNLTIDNCASGGKRLDIETMKRSYSLWRSDMTCRKDCPPEVHQIHNITIPMFWPEAGTGMGLPSLEFDVYGCRSTYATGLVCNQVPRTKEEFDFVKKIGGEYLKLRPYFYGDMYPLTQITTNKDVWSAVQYNIPENDDGMIQIFRREESPYETACFKLREIDRESDYLFTDCDGGEFTVSGKLLTEKGFEITIPQKRSAKIFIYKKI